MPPLGISNITAGPLTVSQAWSRLRGPITGVGTGVCPYADTFGPANQNGVRGYVGPPASSLWKPINWYVRIGGSNTNGGDTPSLTPEQSGSDGVTSSGTNGVQGVRVSTCTFSSVTASFNKSHVGRGIAIGGGFFRITALISPTSVTVVCDGGAITIGSFQAWAVGGAWADLNGGFFSAGTQESGVFSGDTIYVGAGVYRKTLWGISVCNPFYNGVVNIVGDVTGQYTGDAGMVQLTAYTTNDKTAPPATSLLVFGGRSNIAFSNIMFVGGNQTMLNANTATSQNITFTDCVFHGAQAGNLRTLTANNSSLGLPFHWLFDRCVFVGGGGSNPVLAFTLVTVASGNDYDADVTIRNCSIPLGNSSGSGWCNVVNTGTLTFKGGGIRMRNVFALVAGLITTTAAQISTIFPCSIFNSFIWSSTASASLNAGTSGQIIEDYNLFVAALPRTNVTAGAHSISDGSYAPFFHAGQERIWSGLLRPFGEPMAGSPLLGFGNDGGQTTYDYYNRPRPAGGGALPYPAVGALERGNTPTQAASPIPPTGTYDWQFTGPGFQEFLLPVNNTSTTVSIRVQRDSAYSPPPGATLPAMQILANGRLGIPAQTIVDTGSSGGWNPLSAQAFTPSGTGWVTVRIASFDGTGVSVVSFANLVVAT